MAGLVDTTYQRSPIWLQQIGVAAYGWWWYHRRFGEHFHAEVAALHERERWSAGRFLELQENRLDKLLTAARASSYYGRMIGDLAPGNAFQRLAQLPQLSKETLRTRASALLTQAQLPRRTMIMKTSGSTGTPSEIYYPPDVHEIELAVSEARSLNWAGVNFRDRRAMFGVRKVCRFEQRRPPFWRYSPAEDLAYASIYHLSDANIPHYIEFLRRFRPKVVMGYPSALGTLAAFAVENRMLPAPATAVITTSETVLPETRTLIEQAWSCRLFDRYGAVENCLFASQCEYGAYHVSPEVGIVEILDDAGNPAAPGELGTVVCTGLLNELQPLIRYAIGDMARWAIDQSCRCGRQMAIIEGVEGRYEDMCYTPDGRRVLRFDTVFKGVSAIGEAQVVQCALHEFEIRVVPKAGYSSADEARLIANMRLHVGDLTIRVVRVDAIARSSSGKFRAVLCQIPAEEKARLRARHMAQV